MSINILRFLVVFVMVSFCPVIASADGKRCEEDVDVVPERITWADYAPGTMAEWKWLTGRNRGLTLRKTVVSNDQKVMVVREIITDKAGVIIDEKDVRIDLVENPEPSKKLAGKGGEVLGNEKVEVPAGLFDCELHRSKSMDRFWLSDEVPFNVVRKRSGRITQDIFELVKYKLVLKNAKANKEMSPEEKNKPVAEKHPWADMRPGTMVEMKTEMTLENMEMVTGMRMTVLSNDGKVLKYFVETMDKDGKVTYKGEMKMDLTMSVDKKLQEQWKKIGWERVSVPAGAFDCEVWEGPNGVKMWRCKTVPFGMGVKMIMTKPTMRIVMTLIKMRVK